jgi:hypothetical protein
MMAANLCEAWGRITIGLIQDAWDIYDGEDWESLIAEDIRVEEEDLKRAVNFAETRAVEGAQ